MSWKNNSAHNPCVAFENQIPSVLKETPRDKRYHRLKVAQEDLIYRVFELPYHREQRAKAERIAEK